MINFHVGKSMLQGMAEEMKEFFTGKMRREALVVKERRRRTFMISLGLSALVFVVLFAVCWHFLQPFSEVADGMDLWALYLLLPLTVAVLAFSIMHILSLRAVLNDFKAKVTDQFAEFINPAVVHDTGAPMSEKEIRDSLMFPATAKLESGPDRFRGALDGVGYRFCHLGLNTPSAGPAGLANGLFFHAEFSQPFRHFALSAPEGAELSLSQVSRGLLDQNLEQPGELVRLDEKGLGRQLVVRSDGGGGDLLPMDSMRRMEELRLTRNVQSYFSCLGKQLYIALLSPQDDPNAGSCFDDFNFDHCLNFSAEARTCLELVRELGKRPDMFKAN